MKQKQKTFVSHTLQPTQTNFWASIGFVAISAIFLVSAIMLLGDSSITQAQSQSNIAQSGVSGADAKIEYLASLSFMQEETFDSKVKLTAATGSKPTLLAEGAVTVGSGNTNTSSSFIGGGIGNSASATNTVIVGGINNETDSLSVSPVILGGKDNTIAANVQYGLIAGGEGNQLRGNSAGAVILGGKNNKAAGGVILGMSNNEIKGSVNNIVAGNNILVNAGISNTFVRSDASSFSPLASKAFYINTTNGVGINTPNPQVKFDSNGPVKIGSSNNATICNEDNVGVIQYKGGYLCACTANNYWTTLSDDTGAGMEVCNNGNIGCIYDYDESTGSGSFVGERCDNPTPSCGNETDGFTYCFDVNFETPSTIGSCQSVPANSIPCIGSTVVTGTPSSTLVETCGTNKCEYFCAAGYVKNGNTCVPSPYSCYGSTPWAAELCTGSQLDLTVDTERKVYATCGTNKCAYTCKTGYTYENGACIPRSCKNIPENAIPCEGSNIELTSDTPSQLVNACTTAKCEYVCADGYALVGNNCELTPKEGCEDNSDCGEGEICDGYTPADETNPAQFGTCTNKYVNPAIYYIADDDEVKSLNWYGNTVYNLTDGEKSTILAENPSCSRIIDESELQNFDENSMLDTSACLVVNMAATFYGGVSECAKSEGGKWYKMEDTKITGLPISYQYTPTDIYLLMEVKNFSIGGQMKTYFGNAMNYLFHKAKNTLKYQDYETTMINGCYETCKTPVGLTEEECKNNCEATWKGGGAVKFETGSLEDVTLVVGWSGLSTLNVTLPSNVDRSIRVNRKNACRCSNEGELWNAEACKSPEDIDNQGNPYPRIATDHLRSYWDAGGTPGTSSKTEGWYGQPFINGTLDYKS